MSSEQTQSSIKRLAFEVLSIFLAVFLAFGVTEWGKSRSNKQLAETAREAIVKEIARNKGLLEQMLPMHEALLEEVSNLSAEASVDADSHFFLPIIFRNTAWRMASETGAFIHMDYSTATSIAEIYTFQEAYSELTQSMMASSFNISNYDASPAARQQVIQYIAYVFVQNERSLIQAYQKAYDELSDSP